MKLHSLGMPVVDTWLIDIWALRRIPDQIMFLEIHAVSLEPQKKM